MTARARAAAWLPVLLAALLTGCSSTAAPAGAAASELRLGYLPNLTQATALYGVTTGSFQQALGTTTLKASAFTAGPAVIEAMRGGSLDAAFVGPNPAINGFVQTDGELLRIVAGTTSGGAALVTRPSISSVEQLSGRKVATPQLGNTQDVAAKAFFQDKGVDVDVVNQENAQTLALFKEGKLDGAWVPEPWVSRLVLDGGGRVLLDEKTLWPQGDFVTTHLVVSQQFLSRHPASVEALLRGLLAATDVVATRSAAVQRVVNDALLETTGKRLAPEILAAAFAHLTPTVDPVASSLVRSAQHAEDIGLLKPADLQGIYDLTIVNRLLRAAGKAPVSDASRGVS